MKSTWPLPSRLLCQPTVVIFETGILISVRPKVPFLMMTVLPSKVTTALSLAHHAVAGGDVSVTHSPS
jgi:hypothetical protein